MGPKSAAHPGLCLDSIPGRSPTFPVLSAGWQQVRVKSLSMGGKEPKGLRSPGTHPSLHPGRAWGAQDLPGAQLAISLVSGFSSEETGRRDLASLQPAAPPSVQGCTPKLWYFLLPLTPEALQLQKERAKRALSVTMVSTPSDHWSPQEHSGVTAGRALGIRMAERDTPGEGQQDWTSVHSGYL